MTKRKKKEELVREGIASAEQIKSFMDSIVWADMKAELIEWSDSLTELLRTEKDVVELHRHQGRSELVLKVLQLPDVMLQSAIYDDERKALKKEAEEDIN